MSVQAGGALTYRPELDGLRAIAVLSVVFYHFGVPGLGGGFVGVDIFFVISGFLIGTILWREYCRTGRVSLRAFYLRRFRRLAPAWTVMVAAAVSTSSICRMRSSEITTHAPCGVAPPASPVRPPCATTGWAWSLQMRRIVETSSVERG